MSPLQQIHLRLQLLVRNWKRQQLLIDSVIELVRLRKYKGKLLYKQLSLHNPKETAILVSNLKLTVSVSTYLKIR